MASFLTLFEAYFSCGFLNLSDMEDISYAVYWFLLLSVDSPWIFIGFRGIIGWSTFPPVSNMVAII